MIKILKNYMNNNMKYFQNQKFKKYKNKKILSKNYNY